MQQNGLISTIWSDNSWGIICSSNIDLMSAVHFLFLDFNTYDEYNIIATCVCVIHCVLKKRKLYDGTEKMEEVTHWEFCHTKKDEH